MFTVHSRLRRPGFSSGLPPIGLRLIRRPANGSARSANHQPGRSARLRAAALMWRLMAHGTRPGDPHGVLLAWALFERFTTNVWHLLPVAGAAHDFLRLRIVDHRGKSLTLPDSTEIRSGSLIGELHINNEALLQFMSRKQMNLFVACRQDMRSLARWLEQADPDEEIQALSGFTLLVPIAARLGFVRLGRTHRVRARLDRMFMHGLLVMYSVNGLDRISRGAHLLAYPEEVWMSRRELIRRYGCGSGNAPVGRTKPGTESDLRQNVDPAISPAPAAP